VNKRTKTTHIIIHCSATPPAMDVGTKEIREWHKDRGWSDVGYNVVIRRGGKVEVGRPLDARGAHAKGYNSNSVGVCMIGGVNEANVPEKNFTPKQWESLVVTIAFLIKASPEAKVIGHNEVSDKACPSFDVQEWYESVWA
jgi:hypothetical protein